MMASTDSENAQLNSTKGEENTSEKKDSPSAASQQISHSTASSVSPHHQHQQIRVQQPDDEDSNDGSNGHNNDSPTIPTICTPSAFPLLNQNKSNPFASSAPLTSRPLLRPSAFKLLQDTAASSAPPPPPTTTPFVLRPPKLLTSSGDSSTPAPPPSNKPVQNIQFMPLEKEEEEGGKEESNLNQVQAPLLTKKPEAEASNTIITAPAPAASSEEFVFGKNLSERVVDGGGGVKRKVEDDDEKSDETKKRVIDPDDKESLKKDVQVITGEENEVNVLQLACRLFIFEPKKSSWVERGRGLLRLNDSKPDDGDTKTSRLIIRSKGSLRVMLNTKVWEGMRVEKANDKSVRIMAVDLEQQQQPTSSTPTTASSNSTEDERGLRIFLIMLTSITDAFTLTNELTSRVQKLSSQEKAQ